MNKFISFRSSFAMLTITVLAACSSDHDAPNIRLTTPNTTGKELIEVTHSGNLPAMFDWKLDYSSNKQLVSGVGAYRFGTTSEKGYNATLQCTSKTLLVKTKKNEKITILLNSKNLIEQMNVNGNEFSFSYTNGYLTQWTEIVRKTDLGGTTSYTSSAAIAYDNNGDLRSIAYMKNGDYPKYVRTLSFTSSDRLNVNGLLPEGVSEEMGCLGFEYLFYAGALGKAPNHLIKSVSVVNTEQPELDYTLDFSYVADTNGNVTYCSYFYKNLPAGATYKY
ncbi:MAG: DUF4595 domain-containing protein [Bacteroidaceae bacterium]